MNKNSYFSDITELFLKAKDGENIKINPHAKAATREMLSYKISQIQNAPADSGVSFWNKWKKQLIGVPASLMAVTLVVFAAQNMSVSIPQDDYLPAQEVTTPIFEEDTAIIEDAVRSEEIAQKPKTKPELLTIDYGVDDAPAVTLTQPRATYVQPQEIAQNSPAVESTGGGPTTTESVKKDASSAQGYTSNSSTPSTSNTSDANMPQTLIQKVIPSADVQSIITGDIRVEPNDNPINPDIVVDPTINHYRQPLQPQTLTTFTKEELEKSVKLDILSNVNVHYLNNDQAAVEVQENNETRWYLVEQMSEGWQVVQSFD